ncbi:MAG: efflux RND transporter periplasmic adaptor subunit [Spirochaetales bacterium]|nr:efflux RND transporter periplasmic adaptor subunit [Spirochaetales bacterium]
MARRGAVIVRWIITLAVIGAGLFLIWKFVINRPKKVFENPLAAVVTAKPYRASVDQTLELSGYIEPQALIPVVPFVQGTITGYYAKAGDYVNEGDVLAQIDSTPYELQAKQAEAVYLAAEATFTRVSNLFESGAATRQNYDEAKAQLDAYKAQYDQANVQLGYATVTAPKSGTILMADSAEGSIGTSSNPLYVIADLNSLQINLNVPERYFNLINANKDNIRAIVYRDGAEVPAVVDNVAPYVSPESKTFKVTLKLQGDVSRFRPGMYVRVSMVYMTYENALVLDQTTRNTDGSAYIYDPETQTAKYVSLDVIASDNTKFIIDEKWADTLFIVDGQGTVLDGQKVNAR